MSHSESGSLAEHHINDMDDTVGCSIVHLDDIAMGGLAADGNEGSGHMLGHCKR